MRRYLLSNVMFFGLTSLALAAGSAPLPPPDPTAKNLSPAQIQQRALNACVRTQGPLLTGVGPSDIRNRCSCYARGTVRAMSRPEIQAFRDTGYFNDTTRAKALAQIDSCGLRRPI
ncbi:MAG: hypothetical protein ACRCWO_05440 [Bosea sp. (in: a-proteobacteria)]